MVRSDGKLNWCWFCDLICEFVYNEDRNEWYCIRCGRDLRHWGRNIEEHVHRRNNDRLMDISAYKGNQREYPRFNLNLSFDYSSMDREEEYGGITTNASEGGLLVHLRELFEKEEILKLVILTMKGTKFNPIKCMAKVVWGDLAAKAPWGKHRYGLKFECFHKGSLDEFKILLSDAATLKSSLPPNTAGFK
jgi:hypothetical protein